MLITTPAAARGISSSVRAEAAAWIARLHGPQRSEELETGLRRWLEADPENARAFEGMTEIWDAVGGARAGRFPRLNHTGARTRRAIWLQAAAIVLTCGAAAIVAYSLARDPRYATAIGEQRTIALRDGSHITLNSNTRLIVMYDKSERRIRLDRGEALFDVSASAKRPFIVTAGDQKVTALGTSFIVRHEAGRTAVTLVEGKVIVAPEATRQATRVLQPGERFTVSAQRTEQVDKPAVDTLIAWRRGEVVLDHTPLAEAAAEMNRYNGTAIVIDDPAVAAVRVSGNYEIGDSEGFARAIAAMYGLEVSEGDRRIHLSK